MMHKSAKNEGDHHFSTLEIDIKAYAQICLTLLSKTQLDQVTGATVDLLFDFVRSCVIEFKSWENLR